VNRFAGFVQDGGEGVDRTGEKAKKSSRIDLSSIDWECRDGVLDLNAGVGSAKLVSELNFIGGPGVHADLGGRAERKQQKER
jgi:hypothetical protein